MSFDVKIESSAFLVRIQLHDLVDIEVVREAMIAYLSHQDFRPGMGRLYVMDADCDLSKLDVMSLRNLSALTANDIAERTDKLLEARYQVAVVCSTRVVESLMRLYKAVFDEGAWTDVDLAVFMAEDEARIWLSGKLDKTPKSASPR